MRWLALKGEIIIGKKGSNRYKLIDQCYDSEFLIEWVCKSPEGYEQKRKLCELGCVNGYCVEGKTEILKPTEDTGIIEIPENALETTYVCNGCESESKCFYVGYLKENEYCSDTNMFVPLIKKDAPCENSYECSSNICKNNICVNESLLKKIFNWFKKIF